jgi:hypothetical protein
MGIHIEIRNNLAQTAEDTIQREQNPSAKIHDDYCARLKSAPCFSDPVNESDKWSSPRIDLRSDVKRPADSAIKDLGQGTSPSLTVQGQ